MKQKTDARGVCVRHFIICAKKTFSFQPIKKLGVVWLCRFYATLLFHFYIFSK